MQSRLDYWVISESLKETVLDCTILPSLSPDHSAVELSINFKSDTNSVKRAAYWKFNNSLCNDEIYVKSMKEEIIRLKLRLSEEITDNRLLWDFIKMEIRSFTRKYSKKKAKERKERIAKLEQEILKLEEETQTPNIRDFDLSENLQRKRRELKDFYVYISEGVKIRSRASWFEIGERETAYFKQLRDSNGKKCMIKELKVNGNTIVDESKIIQEIRNFYSILYAQSDVGRCENINFFPQSLPKLTENQRNHCEVKINQGDCIETLKEMQLNKSPGNDGLNVEFYITFWQVIYDLVIKAFNDTLKFKELSPSQRQAVITLIHKDGKDPNLISNYRPISLLNVDYKILTKTLSKKMKTILSNIVSVEQVGYLTDRNIGEAIRIINDMIFHTSHFNKPGYLLAIDFEKAFDSISHSFLQKVLTSFGFGPIFRKWVDILYTNSQSCVFNGGTSTGYFKVERGLKQGDPLAPYLFILCIECLSHCIQKDNLVKGIHFGDTEIKQVLYADDMTIFVRDIDSIHRLEVILESYRKISGLRINGNKTFILPLGSLAGSASVYPFGKEVEMVKILGIYFSLDPDVSEALNYKEILSKIKKLLNWWKQRDLTLIGKIHLLKTYAYSKLIYVSSLTPVPEWAFKEIEETCFNFLWRRKDKIKRDTLYLDYKQGGLKMLNFRLFVKVQRVMWIKRLVTEDQNMKWKKYLKFLLRPLGGNLIFYCNYVPNMINIQLPKYYQEMLEIWFDMNAFIKKDATNKRNEIFFNNMYIHKEGKMYFNKDLFLKRTYKLHHITDDEGLLKSQNYFRCMGFSEEEIVVINEIYAHIPDEWRDELRNKGSVDGLKIELFLKTIVPFESVCSKNLYRECIKKLAVIPVSFHNLQLLYNMSVKEIEQVFLRPRISTLVNKLREFQYKLINNIIYVNHHLYRFNFTSTDKCSYCGKKEETYKHIFF